MAGLSAPSMRFFFITFVLVLSSFSLHAETTEPSVRFERISLEQGLSQVSVLDIIQDARGFIWIATQDGLNRYDGYEFKVFKHDSNNPNSIAASYINSLFEDSQGRIWTATSAGASTLDPDTEQFSHLKFDPESPNSLSGNYIHDIVEDCQGNMWINASRAGLDHYNVKTKKVTRFTHKADDPTSISSIFMWQLLVDKGCNLWIATNDGLNMLAYSEQYKDEESPDVNPSAVFIRHQPQQSNPKAISGNSIYSMFEDAQGNLLLGTSAGLEQIKRDQSNGYDFNKIPGFPNVSIMQFSEDDKGRIWIATIDLGLVLYDRQSQQFNYYQHAPDNPNSLSNNYVWSIALDRQNILWVGTLTAGLNKLNPNSLHFNHYKSQMNNPASLSNDIVKRFALDNQNQLWVATDNGLNRFDAQTRAFTRFKNQRGQTDSLSANEIQTLLADSKDNLWVGTGWGLNLYHPQTQTFTRMDAQSDGGGCLVDDRVQHLFEDSSNSLWVTYHFQVCRKTADSKQFVSFPLYQQSSIEKAAQGYVVAMLEYPPQTFWFGTNGGGLIRYHQPTDTFNYFLNQSGTPFQMNDSKVYAILLTGNSKEAQSEPLTIWFGSNLGLSRYQLATGEFVRYFPEDGLPGAKILGLAQDNQGNVWLSSNKGLSRFNPKTEKFQNFGVQEGLQSSEFNSRAAYQSADGELFFGGVNGFNRFYPKHIQVDTTEPQLALTDLLLANQPVAITPGVVSDDDTEFVLPKAIDRLDHITLSHKQNLVTFEFSALHFIDPAQNRYAYRLDGQDEQWIYTDAKNRRATYTNLPAGDYTLRVKASNHQQHWQSQEKTLALTVLPPPWKTWWAYTLYSLTVLSIVTAMAVLFVKSQRQKVIDEKRLNRKLNKLKDQFLANTSHELRTPLNGIIGLSESMIDGATGDLPDATQANLAMVVASGRRLANLVNDILDFQKLKDHQLQLNRQPVNIFSLTELVFALSKPLLGNKSLVLCNNVSPDLPCALADENRLEQIFHNLISNAIKYTEQGSVTVCAEADDSHITIGVNDTGIGIDNSQFGTIFRSFEQLQSDENLNAGGTGLGLAVTKQLVELHGGNIEVTSTLGRGSTFSFTLAISEQQIETKDFNKPTLIQTRTQLSLNDNDIIPFNIDEQTSPPLAPSAPAFKLLVVDDEPINRQVVKNFLSIQNYQLVEADSGEQALNLQQSQGPFDLVLLDIMMPNLSGYDVCKQLREHHSNSDLPIIFLSAKNQVSDLTHSFALGGNDYLCKPVSKHELLARVETHLSMLDIHRNLEQKVKQRTASLKRSLEQLKVAQQQLHEAKRMATLGHLVAGVAHEVNTPLGICITMVSLNIERLNTFAGLLTSGKVTRKAMDNYLTETQESDAMVERNLHKAATLIQEFKKVAVTQSDHNQAEIVFHEHLKEVIKSMQTQLGVKQIEIKLTSNDNFTITTFPGAWIQILEGLFKNAITHGFAQTNEGEITLNAALEEAHYMTLRFADNGVGMNQEQLENIYEPFYTTIRNRGGTGLGMQIVYNLVVHKLKGSIECHSELGQGTEFIIKVPIEEQSTDILYQNP